LRNGHPCLSLTVPTTKPVTDFHRQDVTHAGRTEKRRGDSIMNHLYAIFWDMSQILVFYMM
ncbi:hypothetical protein, partial [Staphylococcus felis]|uniref:hypothetical protein n=1 Tax=Staphylococcus felis TaxID=46127 RepID=UPI001EE7DC44